MPTHNPTTEELRFLADRSLAQDKDHKVCEGYDLDWLTAQLTEFPTRVHEDRTMNIRYLMLSAAATLRQLRDLDPDVLRRLNETARTLENANGQAFPIGFHQLAYDIRHVTERFDG